MRATARATWSIALLLTAGCYSVPVFVENPTTVVNPNWDVVWEDAIDVITRYFEIAYENRYDGRIETKPLASATLLEPWRHDAVDFDERLEATLQTIRRRGFFLIQPAPTGGFQITVEIYKEMEYTGAQTFTSFGRAGLVSSIEPTVESIVSSPVPPARGWISLGRDTKLEAKIAEELQRRIDCAPL